MTKKYIDFLQKKLVDTVEEVFIGNLQVGDIVKHEDGDIGIVFDHLHKDEVTVHWLTTDTRAARTSLIYLKTAFRIKK